MVIDREAQLFVIANASIGAAAAAQSYLGGPPAIEERRRSCNLHAARTVAR